MTHRHASSQVGDVQPQGAVRPRRLAHHLDGRADRHRRHRDSGRARHPGAGAGRAGRAGAGAGAGAGAAAAQLPEAAGGAGAVPDLVELGQRGDHRPGQGTAARLVQRHPE